MVSIKTNHEIWNNDQHWENGCLGDGVGLDEGEKWSRAWGSSVAQWKVSLLPRIRHFLPQKNGLEIAPGRGRWTQYLVEYFDCLVIVDLSENCIDYCNRRFKDIEKIKCFTNNGSSLPFLSNGSVDFIFSFDSLVHVDLCDMKTYIKEFSRVLSLGGVGFIHHSNLAAYNGKVSSISHMRAPDVSADLIAQSLVESGLKVIDQEVIPWTQDNKEEGVFIDAFTTFSKTLDKGIYQVINENANFLIEQEIARKISEKSE